MPVHLGEQLTDPTDTRLTLSAQLGVEQVALHRVPPGAGAVSDDCAWDAAALRSLRERYAREFGLGLEVLGLDVERLWFQLLADDGRAEATLRRIEQNVRAAGDAGIPCLKYRIQPLGVTRTGRVPGRGGARYSQFRYADWQEHEPSPAGSVSHGRMWGAIERFLERVVPIAERAQVRLACHPQDAPLPPEGLRGLPHVLSSIASLDRFLAICPSPYHGLNFCQGTVAEMCREPATEVPAAIHHLGAQRKLFMVHFRNIRGGFGDFVEVYPDNGDVDMLAAARAYHEVEYDGMLCPDHVPQSNVDPHGERQFAFCLGYTRAAIQAARATAPTS
jgi:mannonate dehydratase